ncbi:MAG: nitrite reductase small subunit NirD [Planctomycetes bacterium]|nr:nitrite reductase small subunit NirD [Planctomycetota bacterium]
MPADHPPARENPMNTDGASATSTATALAEGVWTPVCALADIVPDTGVCALIGGRQIAIVRVGQGDTLYAISNYDPFSRAMVLARGIVGDRGGIPKITSPIYKQGFDLRSGQCLDEPSIVIPVYAVRLQAGMVEVLAGG